MDNLGIARALEDLADLLELSGEAPFPVRAFRNASRAIEGTAENIAELSKKGELEKNKIKGIGGGVARRIKELLETGKIAEVDELRAKLPPGLLDLMNVPGIGLKTAQQVWKERGITTVDALEAAAQAGQLRELPRFGQKKEEKLVVAIAAWKKRASQPKRRLMAEALVAAETIVTHLKALEGVLACEPAGSLRRRAETVGDLDILVSADPKHAAAIHAAFRKMPDVVEVLAEGDSKSSVVLDGGMQCDLRVVEPASWGAAMQYFTGSKDHNVAMRTIAVKKHLKVSEYGVFDAEGKKIAGETEASVYEAIGLRYMPPELRENRGEIEASVAGTLPALVELSDLRGDLHMHTTETDGKSTLEQMAEAAHAAGRSYVAITDHSESLTFVRGMDKPRLFAQVKKLREVEEALAKAGTTIRLFAGVEADILGDGSLDLDDALLDLDWVVGSVHSHLNMPREEQTKRVVRAIESGKIDCLGHATGRQLGVREGAKLDMEVVLAAAKRAGVAVELNSSPLRLDVDEHTCKMAREMGVPVVINSDAHGIRELAYLRYGIGIARRAWLTKKDVLNTRSAEDLQEWRRARAS